MVWVIIFVLLLGALAIFSLKSLPGTRMNKQAVEAALAQRYLSGEFPDSRFRVQFSTPNPGVRNLIVTIQPGRSDSAAIAEEADSAESVIRRKVDLTHYDSLVIAVFDRVYRAVPAR